MEIHLVYHGTESGTREDCSVFYEKPEAFLSLAGAELRHDELLASEIDWVHMISVNIEDAENKDNNKPEWSAPTYDVPSIDELRAQCEGSSDQES